MPNEPDHVPHADYLCMMAGCGIHFPSKTMHWHAKAGAWFCKGCIERNGSVPGITLADHLAKLNGQPDAAYVAKVREALESGYASARRETPADYDGLPVEMANPDPGFAGKVIRYGPFSPPKDMAALEQQLNDRLAGIIDVHASDPINAAYREAIKAEDVPPDVKKGGAK